MKKILLLSICIFVGVWTLSAQQTLFVIDNETVENFDGSQLKGKFVKDYKVTTTGTGRNAITVHAITTARSSFYYFPSPQLDSLRTSDMSGSIQFKADTIYFPKGISAFQNSTEKVVYVIDGKVSNEDDFRSISRGNIMNITILKGTKAKAYGDNVTVIMIQTNKGGKGQSETFWDLNGIKKEADGSITMNGKPMKTIEYKGRTYFSLSPE